MNKTQTKSLSGFTLTEVLVVAALTVTVVLMVTGFFMRSMRTTFLAEQRNHINTDIRQLTSDLTFIARQANYMVLYESFDEADRSDRSHRRFDGETGDFLVFGFQTQPDLDNPVFAPRATNRIVGYYRAPSDPGDPRSPGPVRRFDIAIPPPEDPNDPPVLEDLLPAAAMMDAFPEVVFLSEGLARDHLFYNFGRQTVMVNGMIIHGHAAKSVTDTYNLTIATRR